MKTLLETVKLTQTYLEKKGIPAARRDSEDLVSMALGLKRLDLYLQHDRPLNEDELTKIRLFLERRGKREPLQYIVGEIEFLNLKIKVASDVLIPRQETELWVSEIRPNGKVVWDICTGSGAIALSLKQKFPDLEVHGSDLSKKALVLAKENARVNNLEVSFHEGDLFHPFFGKKADLITINPPYISEKEYLELEPEVKNFEPKEALVGGKTGFEFYEKIKNEICTYLNPGAEVYLEMGIGQKETLLNLFSGEEWEKKEIKFDLSGHPRCLYLKFKGNSLNISPIC